MFIITLPSEAIARGIREFSPSIGMEALLVGIATFKTFRRLMVGLSASPFFFCFFAGSIVVVLNPRSHSLIETNRGRPGKRV